MDVRTVRERRRFFAALALFLLWAVALGLMAGLSGRKPINDSNSQSAR